MVYWWNITTVYIYFGGYGEVSGFGSGSGARGVGVGKSGVRAQAKPGWVNKSFT